MTDFAFKPVSAALKSRGQRLNPPPQPEIAGFALKPDAAGSKCRVLSRPDGSTARKRELRMDSRNAFPGDRIPEGLAP